MNAPQKKKNIGEIVVPPELKMKTDIYLVYTSS